MIKQILFLLAVTGIAVVQVSCTSDQSSRSQSKPLEPYTLERDTFYLADEDCVNECTYISLDVPKLRGGDAQVRDEVNNYIDRLCYELIMGEVNVEIDTMNYQALCASFIEGHDLFLMEFPDSEGYWYYKLNSVSTELGKDFIALIITTDSYTGGAHPNQFVIARTLSLKDGEEIRVEDIYDRDGLLSLGERYFRNFHGISDTTSLNDSGYMFPDGQFVLPENLTLTKEGVFFFYNSYEVASYAEGPTVFVLPYDSLDEKMSK